MNLLETLARIPWLHYWEQRLAGFGFYRKVRSLFREEGLFRPGLDVLEMGCGQGILSNWFKDGRYVGIDTDLASLKFARARRPANYFLFANAAQAPFPEAAFDVAISVGILHHLNNSDLAGHFREVLRVLKKGGKMIVVDSLKPERRDFLRYLCSALERGEYLRTEEELGLQWSQCQLPPSHCKRFNTLLLQNYTMVIQKV